MSPAGAKPPRPYLRAGERRDQLLEAAAALVGEAGWDALGMQRVAEAAGVSRQLVYEHFANLETLRLDLTRFLFAGVYVAISEALDRHPEDLAAAARTGILAVLELPRGSRLAFRDLTAHPTGSGDAVDKLRARLRERVTDVWVRPIRRQARLEEREARALAWMMNVAAWALCDLVDDGSFTPDEAADFYVGAAVGAVAALENKPQER